MDSIVLECAASGCPKPVIKWTKVDDRTTEHTGSSFRILNIQRTQSGTYACSATTAGTRVSVTTTLTILCKYQSALE